MLKCLDLDTVGVDQHRSGWPYCMDALQPLFDQSSPVLLDDFIERTFFYNRSQNVNLWHRQPWVGIMHHPPDMPTWYMDKVRLQHLEADLRWNKSLPNLRMIIAMGDNLRDWCRDQWPEIPCVTVKHPTGLPQVYWSPDAFMAHARKKVAQVGWFLRNIVAITQARVPAGFRKIHVRQTNAWTNKMTVVCRQVYEQLHPERKNIGEVEVVQDLSDIDFDILLGESVVLVEVISAVANNTVVECMIRNTPICLNRHPGPVGYLGADYPLFYDHFDQIEQTLTIENIMAAHEYLRRMDKWWLSGAMFREQVQAACLKHVPECRATVRLPSQTFCDP